MTARKNLLLVTIFTSILFTSCISESSKGSKANQTTTDTTTISEVVMKDTVEPEENFRAKFHGSYMIEIKGIPTSSLVEVYNLNENGKSQWLFIEVNSKGEADIKQTKQGTLTATENSIEVNITGNTGVITESYEVKNKVLTNVENSAKYLKKTE
jgi:hypothetical protein